MLQGISVTPVANLLSNVTAEEYCLSLSVVVIRIGYQCAVNYSNKQWRTGGGGGWDVKPPPSPSIPKF